ncbi:MAG: hypothetical protein PHY64_11165, partial [Eubacteriales bacterium]|nr:hypothetical protein [Eubacteriales bacterium]
MQALKGYRGRRAALLILNAAIILLELQGLRLSVQAFGVSLVQFYTQDSNLLALAASLTLVFALLKNGKDGSIPKWVSLFNYMAACCLAVTFVVVVCVLSPMEGEGGYTVMLLSGSMLYHHLLCPVLMLFSFVVLEPAPSPARKYALVALAPTAIYAAAAIALNLVGVLDGPYPFLHVTTQPVYESVLWFAVILGGAYAIARLVLIANR